MTTPAEARHRLGDIVAQLGGELIGDPDIVINRLTTLKSAGPGDIAFLSNVKYRSQLSTTRAAAVILSPEERDSTHVARIVSKDPYVYFARLAQLFNPEAPPVPGVHASAVIESDVLISASAAIGANCHIGRGSRIGERVVLGACCCLGEEVEIGDDSRLYASVTLYRRSVVGKRAIIHSGVVIGGDGFGMALDEGRWIKIPQTGQAIIGDDVEIGANTTIDRGALDDTVIGDGVKLDNQIQIGHNVHLGDHTAIAGCVGIAGSTRIGKHCTIGGAAAIAGHLDIADHVNISAATLVIKSIREPGTYTGAYPMFTFRDWTKNAAHLRNLSSYVERIDACVDRIDMLEKELAALKRGK